jgi:multidrug resistance protein, MATE family
MEKQPLKNIPPKKRLWESYIAGITDRTAGERYVTIISYFLPELITAFLSWSILNCIDAYFIAHLKSTILYNAQSSSFKLIHLLMKIAEGLSISTIVLCGNFNGMRRFEDVGRAAVTAFWTAIFIGAILASSLFFGAHFILARCLHVPAELVVIGVPFLRVRALGIFFAFIYFAIIGFLRGIKRPGISMKLFLLGGSVFIFFDYVLVFGKCGFPQLQLQGSAFAAVIQYAAMVIAACLYVLFDADCRSYKMHIFKSFDGSIIKNIFSMSWPIIIDKSSLTIAKLWMLSLIAPMGQIVLGSFNVISEMEQLAFVPGLALAQVITFLVSNDYGIRNWQAIKNNTKKVMFLTSVMVLSILVIFSWSPTMIISLFDRQGAFTRFAALAFPLLSTLVIFDVLQLILAGALRGASNVKTVMWTRLIVTLTVFMPISYYFAHAPIANPVLKFVLVFGSYYVSNGVMSLIFIYRFRQDAWKQQFHVQNMKEKEIHDQINIPRDRSSSKDISHQNRTP